MTASRPLRPRDWLYAMAALGAGRAVPNAKLSDREGSTHAGGERWLSTVEQPVPRVPIGEEASRIAAECDDPVLPVAVGTHPYAPSKIASGNNAETT